MPALVIDRQPERDLPPQIPRHRLHRLLIRRPVRCWNSITFANNDGRIDGRPIRRRVALREVLIAHDPITVLGQQRKERALRQRPPNTAASNIPT